METWADAMNVANGMAVMTGSRQWVWRGKATGLWRVTNLYSPIPKPPDAPERAAEPCS